MVADFIAKADFRAEALARAEISAGPQVHNMELRRRAVQLELIPEHSLALITAASPEASLPPGARASVEDPMAEAVSMAAEVTVEAVTGKFGSSITAIKLSIWRNKL
jgi:hypothetical protein